MAAIIPTLQARGMREREKVKCALLGWKSPIFEHPSWSVTPHCTDSSLSRRLYDQLSLGKIAFQQGLFLVELSSPRLQNNCIWKSEKAFTNGNRPQFKIVRVIVEVKNKMSPYFSYDQARNQNKGQLPKLGLIFLPYRLLKNVLIYTWLICFKY